MKALYYRIFNAIKLGFWAMKNPVALHEHNFKMISGLLNLIMKVATENRHRMAHISFVHLGEEKQIVSIWADAGIGAEPTKRIAELFEENSKLKAKLAECVAFDKEIKGLEK